VSLGWQDLRRTVRRRGADAPAQVYPYLLRDERLYPQLGLAVDYFESMVGRPRAELDGEVLVQFFADHRLARAVVASLAGHYRYRRQSFADALDAPTCERLAALGLHCPADLRAALYADVNRHDGGFAADAARTAAILRLAEWSGLAPDAVEALLVLDAEDRAPLVRLGATPTPAEVAVIYNHLVAEAVLRAAARVELELAPAVRGQHADVPAFVRSLAGHAALAGLRPEAIERLGTEMESATEEAAAATSPATRGRGSRAGPRQVALLGEQDALGSWTRHGRRLVRVLGRALMRHPGAVRGGAALVEARGGPYTCSINPDFLQAFVGPDARGQGSGIGSAGSDTADLSGTEVYWDPRPELVVLRRRGEADGWSLRNWPAALVYPEGVLFPDFALARGAVAVNVVVVDTPALAATVRRLSSRLAARGDVLLASSAATAVALAPLGLPTVALPASTSLPSRGSGTRIGSTTAAAPGLDERGGAAAGPGPLAAVLAAARAFEPPSAPPVAALDRVLAAVREAGFLPTERALTLAGCAEEAELAGRLAAAGVEDVRLAAGVGLHTDAFLRRLHGARSANGAA
jgi:hypothetical protein